MNDTVPKRLQLDSGNK